MYYVYRLIDPRDNKTFYVGKGSGDRAYSHQAFRDSNKNIHKDNTIRKIHSAGLEVVIEFEHEGITDEDQAYLLEEQLIQTIGLENLTNICTGSNPPSQKGRTFVMSEETKAKISKAHKGKKKNYDVWQKGKTKETDPRLAAMAKKRSETGNEHQRGKKRKPETVTKIKKALTGRKMTDEQVDKMKKAKKGRTWEEIYGVEGASKRREALQQKKLRTAGMEDIVLS